MVDYFGGIPQITGPLPGAPTAGLIDPGLFPTFPDTTTVFGDDPLGSSLGDQANFDLIPGGDNPAESGIPGGSFDWKKLMPGYKGGSKSGGGGKGKGGLTPEQLAALALLASKLFGGGGQSVADALKDVPALDSLLNLQSSQAQRQDPLHRAVTQLATNLMPNSAFGAGPNRPLIG